MRRILAPVVANEEILLNTWIMRLHAAPIATETRPGQFVHVLCDGDTAHLLRRPLSIFRVTPEGEILLFFQARGAGTAWLSRRQKGEIIDVIGPLGAGFEILPDSHHLLLIAGGMGIAPLVTLADEALKQGKEVVLLAGARTARQVMPKELLPQGIQYFTITEDGSSGHQGLVIDLVPERIDWADQVFACGPKRMFRTLSLLSWPERIRSHIQVSMEEAMACAVGACLGCATETKQGYKMVCSDGPVFPLEQLKWK